MKKLIVASLLLMISSSAFSTKWIVSNSGFTFSPASLTVNQGDTIIFTLESMHNVVEVSQATWDANGNSALAGGFSLGFGGGQLATANLSTGTHWYVCSPHASLGMKGTITINSPTLIPENQMSAGIVLFPNPASDFLKLTLSNSLSGSHFSLIDMSGRVILTGILTGEVNIIDISRLKKGIYFLNTGSRMRDIQRFIKN